MVTPLLSFHTPRLLKAQLTHIHGRSHEQVLPNPPEAAISRSPYEEEEAVGRGCRGAALVPICIGNVITVAKTTHNQQQQIHVRARTLSRS